MPVTAGDYECWVELTTTDAPGDPRKAKDGALTLTKRESIRVRLVSAHRLPTIFRTMTPILLLLHVLAFFLGADRIIVTGLQPNPGGDANVLVGQGWYWVTPTSRLAEVRFVAESSETGQLKWCEVGNARTRNGRASCKS